jgi:ABC-type oligopeptide transport system substrate-binding subunit
VVLERFEAHSGTAYLDRVQIDLVNDPNQAWRDFLRGRSDVAEVPNEALTSGDANRGNGGFTPFAAGLYYGPNLRSPKYAKPEVRKAISLAIDRRRIANEIYGGTKEAATGIIPRGVRGYTPAACADCVKDEDRARQLIQAAFGGKPPEMTIDHLDASPSREVASEIATELKNVGLNVALRGHNSTDYLKLLEAGQHEIAELGWLAEVPSPDGFLAQQLRTGSPNNHTGFADRTFDTLIDQARAQRDDAARLDAYRKAEARAFEAMPLIPIVFFRNHVGVAERVHGMRIDGAGLFDAARVWVDQK